MWSHSVFRDSGLAQLIVGPAGRISVANPAATTLMATSSLTGANLADLIAAPDRGSVDAFLATLAELPAGRSQPLGPVQLVGPGRSRTVQMIGARTRGEGGFDALVIAVHEVPVAEAGAEVPEQLVDPLTGVGTRARGLEALRRATGPGAPGCLLIVDLDGFGWINETLGTVEGDRILSGGRRATAPCGPTRSRGCPDRRGPVPRRELRYADGGVARTGQRRVLIPGQAHAHRRDACGDRQHRRGSP